MKPIKTQPHLNSGTQDLYKFDNGYGASVIPEYDITSAAKSGQWELAVLVWTGDDYKLCYDTPITQDVMRFCSDQEIQDALLAIQSLPKRVKN